MRYLVIDAELGGTGIRNKYESGYISPYDLVISSETLQRLNDWLLKYEIVHYNGYPEGTAKSLDHEGRNIALKIKNELEDVKVDYFSEASMTNEVIG